MANQRILQKIKKLLTLAAKTSNSNEAASALSKAQALMAKHKIDDAEVELADVHHESIILDQNKPPKWVVMLIQIINNAFGCDAITDTVIKNGKFTSQLNFIGIAPNAELAKYAFDVLHRQLKRDRTAYIRANCKRCKSATKTARGDAFAEHWLIAVYSKITALVVSHDHKALIKKYTTEKVLNGGSASKYSPQSRAGNSSRHDDARIAGYQAGKQASLNSPVAGAETPKLTA